MPRFVVKASVTVDIEMSVEAETKEAAEELFDENISLKARLMCLDPATWRCDEDSVTDVQIERIDPEV